MRWYEQFPGRVVSYSSSFDRQEYNLGRISRKYRQVAIPQAEKYDSGWFIGLSWEMCIGDTTVCFRGREIGWCTVYGDWAESLSVALSLSLMMTHPTEKLLVYINYMSGLMRSGSSSESESEGEYHPSQAHYSRIHTILEHKFAVRALDDTNFVNNAGIKRRDDADHFVEGRISHTALSKTSDATDGNTAVREVIPAVL
ncbi:hypothetical protein C8J57DRAFT_1220925 [Mycena rebaudengoi]|nr:hypothetical protein C8J57DRAFT_1220925 [Mycena rebaudengoi]